MRSDSQSTFQEHQPTAHVNTAEHNARRMFSDEQFRQLGSLQVGLLPALRQRKTLPEPDIRRIRRESGIQTPYLNATNQACCQVAVCQTARALQLVIHSLCLILSNTYDKHTNNHEPWLPSQLADMWKPSCTRILRGVSRFATPRITTNTTFFKQTDRRSFSDACSFATFSLSQVHEGYRRENACKNFDPFAADDICQ